METLDNNNPKYKFNNGTDLDLDIDKVSNSTELNVVNTDNQADSNSDSNSDSDLVVDTDNQADSNSDSDSDIDMGSTTTELNVVNTDNQADSNSDSNSDSDSDIDTNSNTTELNVVNTDNQADSNSDSDSDIDTGSNATELNVVNDTTPLLDNYLTNEHIDVTIKVNLYKNISCCIWLESCIKLHRKPECIVAFIDMLFIKKRRNAGIDINSNWDIKQGDEVLLLRSNGTLDKVSIVTIGIHNILCYDINDINNNPILEKAKFFFFEL